MTVLSVIIPAYNEEKTVREILERIQANAPEEVALEVIVVDDGSKDQTRSILESIPELYSQLILMPKNGGKGAAVKAGLKAATGDFVLFQDADLEYDPADYGKMVQPLLEFEADVVLGSRMSGSTLVRVHYFWHKIGNQAITLFFNIMNNTTFTDVYSCYLLFRRSLVDPDGLKTSGWEQHAEIFSKAVSKGRVFFEVPIQYYGRTYDEGKKIRAHHIISVFWAIARFRLFR